MKLENIQKGLTILLKYFDYPNTEAEGMCEAHDGTLWVYETDRPMNDADVQELFNLGWKQYYVDAEGKHAYNPNIGWEAFI